MPKEKTKKTQTSTADGDKHDCLLERQCMRITAYSPKNGSSCLRRHHGLPAPMAASASRRGAGPRADVPARGEDHPRWLLTTQLWRTSIPLRQGRARGWRFGLTRCTNQTWKPREHWAGVLGSRDLCQGQSELFWSMVVLCKGTGDEWLMEKHKVQRRHQRKVFNRVFVPSKFIRGEILFAVSR